MKIIIIAWAGVCFTLLSTNLNAQNMTTHLDKRQQKIVGIAANTAVGNLYALKSEIHDALDVGMTVNEIKEVLVQMYAYCGFPRSLNGSCSLRREKRRFYIYYRYCPLSGH
jgi:alkylhydroperoxidase/carboxymuconolactone decarboxylase family protein YurZ